MSSIFGGSKEHSHSISQNQAYPYLKDSLGGLVSTVGSATGQLGNLLGLNGGDAQNQAFTNWRNSTGYQFGLDQGTQAITGSAAAKGLLNSGATLKALTKYGQNYADTQYGNYFNQLGSLLSQGLTGAGIIGDAGKVAESNSKGSSTKGLGGFIGDVLGKH